ncbi:MAG: heat-shock protein IbpA [Rhodomicrobium sp.]|nr:MAG: heat-shock protein IbpA [Rhodomicrobium sp.]
MEHIDFRPLYRSTVGFDRLFNLLDDFGKVDGAATGYPPYNIQRLEENAYRITMAVAGFAEDEIDIEVKEQSLKINGRKNENDDVEYLHQGIASRTFERSFQLADHVEVLGAKLENGLLHVDLKREIPEQMKPRKIAIQRSAEADTSGQTIEAKVDA